MRRKSKMMDSREFFKKYANPDEFERVVEMDTVVEMWERCRKEYPNLIAIEDNGLQYTYQKLDQDMASFRGALAAKGIKKGDRVGVFARNSYDLVKMYLAVVTLGACAAILPAHLDEKTIYGVSLKFALKGLVYAPDMEERVIFAKEHNPNLIVFSSLEEGEPVDMPSEVSKNDPAVIMFTGGTTGRSKGALLSNGALMQGTVNGCYGVWDIFNQRYILILPLSHVFGLVRNLMTSLYTGSDLYICRNNKDMFRDIAIFRPTILVLVPAIAEMALNLSKQFHKNMLGDSLKYIICGAAKVAPYLIIEYKKIGINLLAGYGLTESANLVSGNPESLAKPDSVGYPYPHQEFRVVNDELWIKGENMMDGYVGEEGANEEAYEDGWFKTGDLVRFDEDGYLYITGRCKEIIVLSNGENVSPAEVESHFNALDIVQDSQLFEDLDENGRHILALEVVPRMVELAKVDVDDKMAYLMEELKKVNASLVPHERAERIEIRDKDFERTPAMKIVRYHKC